MNTSRECVLASERDRFELGSRVADGFVTENVPFYRDFSESVISRRARAAQDSAFEFVAWVRGMGWVPPIKALVEYEHGLAKLAAAPYVDKLYERVQATVRPGSPWPPREA